jgi:tetratricopeptide (TPR) repeat protein
MHLFTENRVRLALGMQSMARKRPPRGQPSPTVPAPVTAVSEKPRAQPKNTYRLTPPLIALALGFGTLLLYSSLCDKAKEPFLLDDADYVFDNPQVQAGLTPSGLSWALTTFHIGDWHPVTWLSLQLDTHVYGGASWGYHLTNVLLHALNAVLLFVVLERMTGSPWRSAFVAALFAVHPLRVESVAWVSERRDVLSAFFWILAMGAYAWYVQRPGLGRYLLVALAFVLGLMSKLMVVTLPLALLLLDCWPLQRISASPAAIVRLLIEKLPLFALAFAGGVLAVLSHRGYLMKEPLLADHALSWRVLNACISCLAYLRMTAWPSHLAPMYTQPPEQQSLLGGVAAGAILLLLTIGCLAQARRRPYLAVGWLWYLGTLLPVLGLFPTDVIHTMADRYTYLPHIGLFIALVWGLADLLKDRCPASVLAAGTAALLLSLAIVTWKQASLWQKNVTLWEHAVRVTQSNYRAHDLLGVALVKAGRLDEAERQYRLALAIEPRFAEGHSHLGKLLQARQQWSDAASCYRAAAAIVPGWPDFQSQHGLCLVRAGQMEEALAPLHAVVELLPGQAEARSNLATALLYRGQVEQADREIEIALRLDKESAEAQQLKGFVLALQGRTAEAEAHFRIALQTTRPDPTGMFYLAWCLHAQGKTVAATHEFRQARQRFPGWPKEGLQQAWQLATDSEASRRNGSLALLQAQVVHLALDEQSPAALDTMAAAYAELGRFEEAAAAAKSALTLADSAGKRDLANGLTQRIRLYEQGQPYREGRPAH